MCHTLHLPSVCITECRRPIREKFQVRSDADGVRGFLLWASSRTSLTRRRTKLSGKHWINGWNQVCSEGRSRFSNWSDATLPRRCPPNGDNGNRWRYRMRNPPAPSELSNVGSHAGPSINGLIPAYPLLEKAEFRVRSCSMRDWHRDGCRKVDCDLGLRLANLGLGAAIPKEPISYSAQRRSGRIEVHHHHFYSLRKQPKVPLREVGLRQANSGPKFPVLPHDLQIRPRRRRHRLRLALFNRLGFTRSVPTPSARAPAFRKSAAVANVTPPVGISRSSGNGASSALR